MRKIFSFFLWLVMFISIANGAVLTVAPASSPVVVLTPEQAQHALNLLNDPQARAQMEDMLRAIAATSALSASSAAASLPVSVSATQAVSSPSNMSPTLVKNGLASRLSHQMLEDVHKIAGSLQRSISALLDMHSVRAWWQNETSSGLGRARLRRLGLALLSTLAFAWLTSAFVGHVIRQYTMALAGQSADHTAQRTGNNKEAVLSQSNEATHVVKNDAHYIARLPAALLHMALNTIPLLVFIVVALLLMPLLTDEGTSEANVFETVIDIYVMARVAILFADFLFAPSAPCLRFWRLSDKWAVFAQRWVMRFAVVLGIGQTLASVLLALGVSAEAHLAILKVVAFIAHLMAAIFILRIRRPVASRIRLYTKRFPAIAGVGRWVADVWAPVTAFFVVALWFVWALDIHNGYRVLLHHGGLSMAVLIGTRLIAIVVLGLLARLFETNASKPSVVLRHAHRYYSLLRNIVSVVMFVVAVDVLLLIWGLDVWDGMLQSTVGQQLLSACTTIAIAALIALIVWEAINISIEHRLDKWKTAGDAVRALRLRTLLPMLRTVLFVAIALVVGLTGLSELGVNTGPLLAGASIFGVALGFGSQKLVQDFITGMFLLMENAMQVGDWVTLAGVSGTVEYLSIRTVHLRGVDGSLYTVPFSSVSSVNNMNRGIGNAQIKVSIAYGQDIAFAITLLKEITAALRNDKQFKDGILADLDFWGVDQIDGAMVTLAGQLRCTDSTRWAVQRELNWRIADTFRARGVMIANPLRNVLAPSETLAAVNAKHE